MRACVGGGEKGDQEVNFDPKMQDLNVRTVTLLRERFQAVYALDWPFSNEPKFESYIDDIAAHHLVFMMQDVAVQKEVVAEYPRDWLEALKERFAPAWVLRRWPVRKTRIDMMVLYPKIKLPDHNPVVRIHQYEPLTPYGDWNAD